MAQCLAPRITCAGQYRCLRAGLVDLPCPPVAARNSYNLQFLVPKGVSHEVAYCGPAWLVRLVPEEYVQTYLGSFYHFVEIQLPSGWRALLQPPVEDDEVLGAVRNMPYVRRLLLPSVEIERLLKIPVSHPSLTYTSGHMYPAGHDVSATTPDPPWLTSIDVSAFSNIEHFEIADPGTGPGQFVDDDILIVLARLPRLRSLTINEGFITSRGIDRLVRRCNLQQLDFFASNINDAAVARLADLTQLRSLNLSSTDITDAALEYVTRIRSLQELDLTGCDVTDRGLLPLAHMPGLRHLAFTQTRQVSESTVELLQRQIPSVALYPDPEQPNEHGPDWGPGGGAF